MRLFWRVFGTVFIFFAGVIGLMSYAAIKYEIEAQQHSLVETNRLFSGLAASEIEKSQRDPQCPPYLLEQVSERKCFLFWWIVDERSKIHQASDESFIGTVAEGYYPGLGRPTGSQFTHMDLDHRLGVSISPVEIRGRQWSFWLGFSTVGIVTTANKIIGTVLAIAGLILLLVGVVLFFMIDHFIRPIKTLTAGAEKMREGDLRHRVSGVAADEFGDLARAINGMAEGVLHREEQLQLELIYRKDAEQELLGLQENLEEEVAQKTKLLIEAREKLFRSEKLAFIGKLAGSVAHELRTPLGAIKNSAYYLQTKLKGSKEENVPKYLQYIDAEVDIANKIISDVLTYARLREPKREAVQIDDVLRESMEYVKVPANILIDIRDFEAVPDVLADKAQVGQVFKNIIANAIQAMPGGGSLDVTAMQKGREVEVDFVDTGEGIDSENLSKIFEPLFSTKKTGIGLGLSTCQTILELHNGRMEVMSEKNKGTTIKVILPVVKGTKEGVRR